MTVTPLRRSQVVSQELIDNIREQLVLAEQGKITDLAFVSYALDEDLPYHRATSCSDGWRLLGAIEYMKNAVIRSLEE